MILKPNSHVKMDVALLNYGCATLIMIVEMIRMNQLTCAAKEIVQQAGNVVLDNRITDAYQNGCSVMEKMIVAVSRNLLYVLKKIKGILVK